MSVRAQALWAALALAALAAGAAGYAWLRSGAAPTTFNAVDVTGADWGRRLELFDHQRKQWVEVRFERPGSRGTSK